jgi:NAD(P)H-nitrite reductase large subunit
LRSAGLSVTVVIRELHYGAPAFDKAAGSILESSLAAHEVAIQRNADVAEVLGENIVSGIRLKDGTTIHCELIVVGIGVHTEADWLKNAGVTVGRGVLCNEYLETNLPDIFVAGDCAEYFDVILGERTQLGNWAHAQSQGRIAALNMLGHHEVFRLVSSCMAQAFGVSLAFVGHTRVSPERQVITRGSAESHAYGQIVLKDSRVVGATLINRAQEVGAFTKLIERQASLAGHEHEIADASVDIATLML